MKESSQKESSQKEASQGSSVTVAAAREILWGVKPENLDHRRGIRRNRVKAPAAYEKPLGETRGKARPGHS